MRVSVAAPAAGGAKGSCIGIEFIYRDVKVPGKRRNGTCRANKPRLSQERAPSVYNRDGVPAILRMGNAAEGSRRLRWANPVAFSLLTQ